MEIELDEFNDETFGDDDIGDWELEHDKFVSEINASDVPPSASDIPKFWESDNFSDFWSPGDLDISQNFDVALNLEETIERLVCDKDFEDPAILDISKRLPETRNNKTFSGVSVRKTEKEANIWSLEKSESSFLNSLCSEVKSTTPNYELCEKAPDKATSQLQQIMHMFKAAQTQPTQSNQHEKQPTPLSGWPTNHTNLGFDPSLIKPNTINQQHFPVPHPLKRTSSIPPLIPPRQQSFSLRLPPNLKDIPPNYIQKMIAANQMGVMLQPPNQCIPNVPIVQLPRPAFDVRLPLRGNHVLPFFYRPFPPTSMGEPNRAGHPNMFMLPIFMPLPQPTLSQSSQPQMRMPMSHTGDTNPLVFLGVRPLELARIEEALLNCEAEFGDEEDLKNHSSWMTPKEHMLVLSCQLRSLSVANPYVEDYYFAVKWLRSMSKERERRIAAGAPLTSLLPPYFHIAAPVSTARLISAEHHHWISRRSRFVRVVSSGSTKAAETKSKLDCGTPRSSSKTRDHQLSSSYNLDAVSSSSHYATQLGRPTKSSIIAQRVIADLSLVTALGEELDETCENSSTTALREKKLTTLEVNFRRMHQNVAVFEQRRRLVTLARIERLYAAVLNINETNVSLARIFIKNEESRHLNVHRLNLLKAILSDLFRKIALPTSTAVPTNADAPSTFAFQQRLNADIFEVPKGIRLFPSILRIIPPEEGQLCTSEFISDFASIQRCGKGTLNEYANLLYTSLRPHIYKGCEKKEFIPSCLPFLAESARKNVAVNAELDTNAVTMFSSSLGVSLFFCLLDACARNSRREDPTLFCDFFLYGCRILDHLSSTQPDMELSSPLEMFSHFSALDPVFLMSEEVKSIYTGPTSSSAHSRLQNCGSLLRWMSVCTERSITLGEALVRASSLVAQQNATPLEQALTLNLPTNQNSSPSSVQTKA